MLSDYAPFVIFTVLVLLVVALILGLSFILGPRKRYASKIEPYESGMIPTTPARQRMSVRFYLTAMLFIIFDVEAVFFYPWAVILRQLRWYGIIEMFVFIAILMVALVHIWRKGGFEWE